MDESRVSSQQFQRAIDACEIHDSTISSAMRSQNFFQAKILLQNQGHVEAERQQHFENKTKEWNSKVVENWKALENKAKVGEEKYVENEKKRLYHVSKLQAEVNYVRAQRREEKEMRLQQAKFHKDKVDREYRQRTMKTYEKEEKSFQEHIGRIQNERLNRDMERYLIHRQQRKRIRDRNQALWFREIQKTLRNPNWVPKGGKGGSSALASVLQSEDEDEEGNPIVLTARTRLHQRIKAERRHQAEEEERIDKEKKHFERVQQERQRAQSAALQRYALASSALSSSFKFSSASFNPSSESKNQRKKSGSPVASSSAMTQAAPTVQLLQSMSNANQNEGGKSDADHLTSALHPHKSSQFPLHHHKVIRSYEERVNDLAGADKVRKVQSTKAEQDRSYAMSYASKEHQNHQGEVEYRYIQYQDDKLQSRENTVQACREKCCGIEKSKAQLDQSRMQDSMHKEQELRDRRMRALAVRKKEEKKKAEELNSQMQHFAARLTRKLM